MNNLYYIDILQHSNKLVDKWLRDNIVKAGSIYDHLDYKIDQYLTYLSNAYDLAGSTYKLDYDYEKSKLNSIIQSATLNNYNIWYQGAPSKLNNNDKLHVLDLLLKKINLDIEDYKLRTGTSLPLGDLSAVQLHNTKPGGSWDNVTTGSPDWGSLDYNIINNIDYTHSSLPIPNTKFYDNLSVAFFKNFSFTTTENNILIISKADLVSNYSESLALYKVIIDLLIELMSYNMMLVIVDENQISSLNSSNIDNLVINDGNIDYYIPNIISTNINRFNTELLKSQQVDDKILIRMGWTYYNNDSSNNWIDYLESGMPGINGDGSVKLMLWIRSIDDVVKFSKIINGVFDPSPEASFAGSSLGPNPSMNDVLISYAYDPDGDGIYDYTKLLISNHYLYKYPTNNSLEELGGPTDPGGTSEYKTEFKNAIILNSSNIPVEVPASDPYNDSKYRDDTKSSRYYQLVIKFTPIINDLSGIESLVSTDHKLNYVYDTDPNSNGYTITSGLVPDDPDDIYSTMVGDCILPGYEYNGTDANDHYSDKLQFEIQSYSPKLASLPSGIDPSSGRALSIPINISRVFISPNFSRSNNSNYYSSIDNITSELKNSAEFINDNTIVNKASTEELRIGATYDPVSDDYPGAKSSISKGSSEVRLYYNDYIIKTPGYIGSCKFKSDNSLIIKSPTYYIEFTIPKISTLSSNYDLKLSSNNLYFRSDPKLEFSSLSISGGISYKLESNYTMPTYAYNDNDDYSNYNTRIWAGKFNPIGSSIITNSGEFVDTENFNLNMVDENGNYSPTLTVNVSNSEYLTYYDNPSTNSRPGNDTPGKLIKHFTYTNKGNNVFVLLDPTSIDLKLEWYNEADNDWVSPSDIPSNKDNLLRITIDLSSLSMNYYSSYNSTTGEYSGTPSSSMINSALKCLSFLLVKGSNLSSGSTPNNINYPLNDYKNVNCSESLISNQTEILLVDEISSDYYGTGEFTSTYNRGVNNAYTKILINSVGLESILGCLDISITPSVKIGSEIYPGNPTVLSALVPSNYDTSIGDSIKDLLSNSSNIDADIPKVLIHYETVTYATGFQSGVLKLGSKPLFDNTDSSDLCSDADYGEISINVNGSPVTGNIIMLIESNIGQRGKLSQVTYSGRSRSITSTYDYLLRINYSGNNYYLISDTGGKSLINISSLVDDNTELSEVMSKLHTAVGAFNYSTIDDYSYPIDESGDVLVAGWSDATTPPTGSFSPENLLNVADYPTNRCNYFNFGRRYEPSDNLII